MAPIDDRRARYNALLNPQGAVPEDRRARYETMLAPPPAAAPAQPTQPAYDPAAAAAAIRERFTPKVEPVQPSPGFSDYLAETGRTAVETLGTHLPAGVAALVEGAGGTPSVVDQDFGDKLFAASQDKQRESAQRIDRIFGANSFYGKMLKGAGPSLGQSLPGMAVMAGTRLATMAGMAAAGSAVAPGVGTVAGLVAGNTAGAAAGAAAIYNQSQYATSMELLRAENERKIAETGQPLTQDEEAQLLAKNQGAINRTAAYDTGPEVVGNILTLGVGKAVASSVFKKAAGEAVERAAKTPLQKLIANPITKIGGGVAGEVGTEAVTAVGQSQSLQGTILADETPLQWTPGDLLTAAEEVLPAVVGTMGAVSGVSAAGGAAAGAYKGRRQDKKIEAETGVAKAEVKGAKNAYRERMVTLLEQKTIDPDFSLKSPEAQNFLRTGQWPGAQVPGAETTTTQAPAPTRTEEGQLGEEIPGAQYDVADYGQQTGQLGEAVPGRVPLAPEDLAPTPVVEQISAKRFQVKLGDAIFGTFYTKKKADEAAAALVNYPTITPAVAPRDDTGQVGEVIPTAEYDPTVLGVQPGQLGEVVGERSAITPEEMTTPVVEQVAEGEFRVRIGAGVFGTFDTQPQAAAAAERLAPPARSYTGQVGEEVPAAQYDVADYGQQTGQLGEVVPGRRPMAPEAFTPEPTVEKTGDKKFRVKLGDATFGVFNTQKAADKAAASLTTTTTQEAAAKGTWPVTAPQTEAAPLTVQKTGKTTYAVMSGDTAVKKFNSRRKADEAMAQLLSEAETTVAVPEVARAALAPVAPAPQAEVQAPAPQAEVQAPAPLPARIEKWGNSWATYVGSTGDEIMTGLHKTRKAATAWLAKSGLSETQEVQDATQEGQVGGSVQGQPAQAPVGRKAKKAGAGNRPATVEIETETETEVEEVAPPAAKPKDNEATKRVKAAAKDLGVEPVEMLTAVVEDGGVDYQGLAFEPANKVMPENVLEDLRDSGVIVSEGMTYGQGLDRVNTLLDAIRGPKQTVAPQNQSTPKKTSAKGAPTVTDKLQDLRPDTQAALDNEILIRNGATAAELLGSIAMRNPTSAVAALYQRLLPFMDQVSIQVTSDNLGDGVKGNASVDAETGQAVITLRSEGGVSDESLSHELVHAATTRAFTIGTMPGMENTELGRAARALTSLFDDIIQRVQNRIEAGKATSFEIALMDNTNLFESPRELLAWGLTNKDVQGWLHSIRFTEKQTLWQKIKSLIGKLFGAQGQEQSALERLLAATNDTLAIPTSELDAALADALAKMRKDMGFDIPMELVTEDSMKEWADQTLRRVGEKSTSLYQRVAKATTELFTPEGRSEWVTRTARLGLPHMPLNSLRDLLGERIPMLDQYVEEQSAFTAIQNGRVDEFLSIIGPIRGRLHMHAAEFNDAALTSSYLQMTPWVKLDQQDWVPKVMRDVRETSTTAQERIEAAEKAWAEAGMKEKTGYTYKEAFARSLESFKKLEKSSSEAAGIYRHSVNTLRSNHLERLKAAENLIREKLANPEMDALAARVKAGENITGQELSALAAHQAKVSEAVGNLLPGGSHLRGAYWPLRRFGTYRLTIEPRDPALKNQRQVQHFETMRERDLAMFDVLNNTDKEQFYIYGTEVEQMGTGVFSHVPQKFADEVVEALNAKLDGMGLDSEQKRSLTDQVGQLWLEAQPEMSTLKNYMKRKSVLGYDNDASRGAITYMVNGARHLADLTHGRKLEQIISDMRKMENLLAQDIAGKELNERQRAQVEAYKQTMGIANDPTALPRVNPIISTLVDNLQARLDASRTNGSNTATRLLTSATSAMFMFSPSAYLVQLSQPFMIGLPKLAAELKSPARAAALIGDAYRTVLGDRAFSVDTILAPNPTDPDVRAAKNLFLRLDIEADPTKLAAAEDDLKRVGGQRQTSAALLGDMTRKQKELAALMYAIRTGALSATMTNEAYDIQKNREGTGLMRGAMWFMKKGEEHSRIVTYLAAFRAKMDSGASFDAANDFAKRTADNTMYVYERAFKPAWMQGKTARAVTQFKYFQLATTAKLFVLATQANSNISASPEVKAQARKELQYMVGMSMLLGGAMGSIPGGAALGLAQLIKNAFGDDDEPANYKGQLTKALGDLPGGDALLYGVFGAFGGDVSGRIGLADVVWPFPDPPAGLHGSALAEWGLNAGAGAGWSMITSLFRGYDKLINEGDVPGALKEASPKAVKDVMRAIEVATEGYKTGTGKVMAGAERFDLTDLLYLTVGILPSEATRAGLSYRATKYTDIKLTERKAELIGNVLDAIERGDREATLAARKELSDLGRKNPGLLKHGDVGRAWDRERKKQAGTQTRSEKRVTSQYGY